MASSTQGLFLYCLFKSKIHFAASFTEDPSCNKRYYSNKQEGSKNSVPFSNRTPNENLKEQATNRNEDSIEPYKFRKVSVQRKNNSQDDQSEEVDEEEC